MVSGAPAAARWIRGEPRRALPRPVLERMVHAAFPGTRLLEAEPFPEGLRNANFKICLDSFSKPIVLRVYEQDASLCQKEIDLLRLVSGSVPVAQVIHTEPGGLDDLPPFALLQFVEGISFRELRRRGDPVAIAQAAFSAGETLASIGRFTFSKPGWLAPGPAVTDPLLEGANPIPRFIDMCLAADPLQRRTPVGLRDRVHDLVWSWASPIELLSGQTCLVHGDFNKRNLIVKQGPAGWIVAAVLDWEFAVSGSPLADIGNFLRYERDSCPTAEPYFSEGFLSAGGTLPLDWRYLTKLVDLAAVCESLTHDDLPATVTEELVEIVRATAEWRTGG
jgi:aminoglycoside phosphotransferase (APT) family kinase protein